MSGQKNITTPSELGRDGERPPGPATPRRSVFGNFASAAPGAGEDSSARSLQEGRAVPGPRAPEPSASVLEQALQASIDLLMARSFIYGFLASAYADPAPETWRWLLDDGTKSCLRSASRVCGPAVAADAKPLMESLASGAFDSIHADYAASFGHAARGRCPLNEIEYGDIKADPLFQPHRLADLAAFYRAFGLEVAPDADERHDHICLELEFMCVLATKEAYALEHQLDDDFLVMGRNAQKGFLREHLGRWTPAFTRRLSAMAGPMLGALASFTRSFIESECRRFDVAPGSEDLLLRPVNEAAESLCASCGVVQ